MMGRFGISWHNRSWESLYADYADYADGQSEVDTRLEWIVGSDDYSTAKSQYLLTIRSLLKKGSILNDGRKI